MAKARQAANLPPEVCIIPNDLPVAFCGNAGRITAEESLRQPPHAHHNWEIILILSGEGALESGDRRYPFTPGTIFCVPPYVPHRNVTDTFFDDYCVGVMTSLLPNDQIAVFQDDAYHSFRDLIALYDRIIHQGTANWMNILRSIESTMQHILIGWQIPQPIPELLGLVQTMQEHLFDPAFKVSDAIRAIPMTADYVRKQFRRFYNCPPVAYLNRLRIDAARKLLLTTDLPVAQIAARCGFSDVKYFARIFHRETGFNTREYRARNGGSE